MASTAALEVWSDLDANIVSDAQGNLKKVINIESVKTSIDNILRTYRGERVFLPQFGSALRDMLFEPINDHLADRLANQVKNSIEIWDNRVGVVAVDSKIDTDNNYIIITIKFMIKSYTETFSHTVTIVQ